MNVHEGARRMRYAGIWLALIAISWRTLVLCIQVIFLFRGGMGAIAGGLGIGEVLIAAAPGVLLWIAGWIVEGFAKEPD